MKFGGIIELGGVIGGYDLVNKPADSLPQDLATALGNVNSGILGATYDPIWYVGKQLVNGFNHLLVCKEVRATKNKDTSIVAIVVNIPARKVGGEGASIVEVIEEAKLDADIQNAFDKAEKQLVGVGYKPIVYIGSQVVRGINHYIVCEAKGIYNNATPYPVILAVNVFEKEVSVVGVFPISRSDSKDGSLFGYAFNW